MTYHISHTNCSIACASILHPSHVDITLIYHKPCLVSLPPPLTAVN
jgi:hypothetical protein